MKRDKRAYLWDIKSAAEAILLFIANHDEQHYCADELLSSAVERKFEIIGEALNQLSKIDDETADKIPHLREIIAFRNMLIHGYATIQHERVWKIVTENLPDLIDVVRNLLGDEM